MADFVFSQCGSGCPALLVGWRLAPIVRIVGTHLFSADGLYLRPPTPPSLLSAGAGIRPADASRL
jgi:hypothetical protein